MADAAPVAVAHDLGYYLRPIRRHPRLIAACVVLGLVLSVAAAAAIRPKYTATAKVQVQADIIDNQSSLANGRTNNAVNMDNEVQLLKSLPVAQIAQKLLKTTTSVGKLEKKITFVVPPNSTFMKISCTAHSPAAAAACANAFANAYLTNRKNAIGSFVGTQTSAIDAKLALYRKAFATDSTAFHAAPPRSQARKTAASKLAADKVGENSESDQLAALNKAATTPPSTLASPAVSGGSSPNQLREMIVLAGIVLGALLGLVAAPMRERLDKLVRTEDDLAREDLELIAEIRPLPRGRRGRSQASRKADALARTRAEQRLAAVIGAALGQEGGSVYVAELSDTVGQQGFADRLAAELGRFGSTTEVVTMGSTLPVSVDHRTLDPAATPLAIDPTPTGSGPAAAPMLGWPSSEPSSAPSSASVADPDPAAGLDVVRADPPAASPPPHTAPPMDEVAGVLQDVQAALARSRYVIVHGPNATIGSEAYNLASLSVVTALIIETGVTTRAQLADVVDQIEITASEVLGAMLWRPAPSGKRHWRGGKKSRASRAAKDGPAANDQPANDQPDEERPVKQRRVKVPWVKLRNARPQQAAKPAKPPKPPKPAKAAKPSKPAKAAKAARGAKPSHDAKPATPTPPPRSGRLLRKKAPPVDGFVPSAPSSVPFASDDDADPGSRARPFDPAR